jgi:hypothetical protein
LGVVLQTTPRAVTAAPPSEAIFPPLRAVVDVMDEGVSVPKVGMEAPVNVVKDRDEL